MTRPSSRSQQGGRYDGDAVGSSVGGRSGVDDDLVEEIVSAAFGQPAQMIDVVIVDSPSEFDLDGDDSAVVAFDDSIDLAASPANPQVVDHRRLYVSCRYQHTFRADFAIQNVQGVSAQETRVGLTRPSI